MKKTTVLFLLLLLPLSSFGAVSLGRITVTAPDQDTVTAGDISLTGASDATGALGFIPGLLSSLIGSRAEGTLFLRGFSIRHVPILVDGIPVSAPFDGYLDLNRFLTSPLAGIQVVKPGDGLPGIPGSFAGAVNLYTRTPSRPMELLAGTEGRFSRSLSPEGIRGNISAGIMPGRWYAMLHLDGLHSGGSTLPSGFDPLGGEDGGTRENAGSFSKEASLRIGYRPETGQEYALLFTATSSAREIPLYAGTNDKIRYWRYPEWNRSRLALLGRTSGKNFVLRSRAWFDGFANTLKSYDSASFTTQTNPAAFTSRYDDTSLGASFRLDMMPLPALSCSADLFFKSDLHREHNEGEPVRDFHDMTLRGGVSASLTTGRRTRVELGVQHTRLHVLTADHYTNSAVVPFETTDVSGTDLRAAFLFFPEKRQQIRLAVGRRTRLPSMKERYSYRLGRAIPNPDLGEETGWNGELSWKFVPRKDWVFTAAVFRTRTEDYILDVTIAPGLTQNRNVGDVTFTGVEIAAGAALVPGLLSLRAGYTQLEPETGSATPTLTGIAKHTLYIQATVTPLRHITLLLSARYVSEIQSASDGSRPAGDFLCGDLDMEWRPTAELRFRLSVKNITDRVIEYEEGYPAPGREYRIAATLKI